MRKNWKLRGYEVEAVTGLPLPGLLVTLYRSSEGHHDPIQRTSTDDKGMWEFSVDRDDTYDVCVERFCTDPGKRRTVPYVITTKWMLGLRPVNRSGYRLPVQRAPKPKSAIGRFRP
jgi:hypothetical protein